MPHARPRGERGRAERRAAGGERIPWVHVAAFIAGTVLVVVFTAHQIGTERETALTHWKTRIATIAADRARLVSAWLAARRADAEVLAAFPAVRALLAGQIRDEETLAEHLTRVAFAYGYVSVVVSDTQGRPVAHSVTEPGGSAPPAPARAAEVATSRAPRFDLSDTGAGRLLTITVPVFADGAPATAGGDARPLVGVVTLGAKPDASLYPLLADDTVPTRTGETLLVDLEGSPPPTSLRRASPRRPTRRWCSAR